MLSCTLASTVPIRSFERKAMISSHMVNSNMVTKKAVVLFSTRYDVMWSSVIRDWTHLADRTGCRGGHDRTLVTFSATPCRFYRMFLITRADHTGSKAPLAESLYLSSVDGSIQAQAPNLSMIPFVSSLAMPHIYYL